MKSCSAICLILGIVAFSQSHAAPIPAPQSSWGANATSNGFSLTGQHTIQNPSATWTGSATVNQGFRPPTTGVNVNAGYTHTPSGSGVSVNGGGTFGQPGSLQGGAQANWNFVNTPGVSVGVTGSGQFGQGQKPNFGVGIGGIIRF